MGVVGAESCVELYVTCGVLCKSTKDCKVLSQLLMPQIHHFYGKEDSGRDESDTPIQLKDSTVFFNWEDYLKYPGKWIFF